MPAQKPSSAPRLNTDFLSVVIYHAKLHILSKKLTVRAILFQFRREIFPGIAFLRGDNLLGRTRGDDLAAVFTALWTDIDDVVGTFDDLDIMLDDDKRMTALEQPVEGLEQYVDVVEMQPCRRFVEDKQRRLRLFLRQEPRELDALILAARQRRRRLPELDISEAYVFQRHQTAHDAALGRPVALAEKANGVVDCHLEHVIDILAAVCYLEHLGFEALAVAALAGHDNVGHKLHLD